MLLGSSVETAYDLRFRLAGVPVRVHPMFWLVMLLLSAQPDDLRYAAVFIVCAFVSLLAHEFGHALAGRLMGYEPAGVVLYGFGGYCSFLHDRQTPWRRLFILAAGPGAGLALGVLVSAVALMLSADSPFSVWPSDGPGPAPGAVTFLRNSYFAQATLDALIWINFAWSVLNLLPVWPLDGGQMMAVGFAMLGPVHGERRAHVVSLFLAGLLAFWLASHVQYVNAFLVGYLAYLNYQWLQADHATYRTFGGQDGW